MMGKAYVRAADHRNNFLLQKHYTQDTNESKVMLLWAGNSSVKNAFSPDMKREEEKKTKKSAKMCKNEPHRRQSHIIVPF